MHSPSTLVASLALLTLHINSVASQDACPANCSITGVPQGYMAGWSAIETGTTLTAATIIEIINTDLGTTRTTTIYNDNIRLPSTNAQGTRTQLVTYTRDGEVLTTKIAFPTSFYVIPQRWLWIGTLSTTMNSNRQSACITTNRAEISVDYYSQPKTITTPTHYEAGDDSRGWLFGAVKNTIDWNIASAFPSEAALASCVYVTATPLSGAIGPVIPHYGTAYVAYTSTSSEGGTLTLPSPSQSLSFPVDNTVVQTTTEATIKSAKTEAPIKSAKTEATTKSTKTVVLEGSSGPITTVQTIGITASAASYAGSYIASFNMLLLAVCSVVAIIFML